ncbi:MAG: hypothetical protein H6658_09985 [Ardenticatenaceae bacterium]|nr:hypothetical protein [Ardenticatenaceae bacterium]
MKRFVRYLPLLFITLLTLASHLLAQETNRVALVVSFGEGEVVTQCVEFNEPEITGLEVLQRAGMEVTAQVQGLGAAVCSIDDTGCPSSNCFCQCAGGGSCRFWNYWHMVDGSWQFSQAGSSIYPIQDGAVEGWAWGVGASGGNGERPPVYSFDQICAPAATDTPVPTDTPLPTNTAVPPTATFAPTHTPTPTPLPAPEIAFWADAAAVAAGSCTRLHWDVEHITAVFLNDFGVEGQGSQEVCPAQTETYTLHIVHAVGEVDRQLTVEVVGATAAVATTTAVWPTATMAQQVANLNTVTAVPATATMIATATAVATHMPTTVTATMAAETAVPTLQPTATFELVPIDIPLLPTDTATTTPIAIAQLPPATTVPTAVPAPTLPLISVEQWLSYAIFGMIVAGLGVMLLLGRR